MDVQETASVLLLLTTICSYINYKFIKLPKAIGITIVALLITIIVNIYSIFNESVNDFAKSLVDSFGLKETFLHGMISFLVFAGSLHLNITEVAKHKFIIGLLSTISVLISTILVGGATYWITKIIGLNLPFYYCLVFGALISPTDAIAVIGVLKTTKLPKSLGMQIAGEALFNDGMSIAIFFMLLAIAYGEEQSIDSHKAIMYFLREGGGGLLLGVIMGVLAAKILKTIQDHELSIILTLTLVTGGYIMASSIFKVSGPICMATTGLIVGGSMRQGGISKDCIRRVEEFWDLIDAILNAILFVLIGLEFIRIDIEIPISIASIIVIMAIIVIRWISIFIPIVFCGKLSRFNTKIITLMTWGGLRGGISIALALTVTGIYRDSILTMTYFVVLWSIIVQGLTLRPMVAKLKLGA